MNTITLSAYRSNRWSASTGLTVSTTIRSELAPLLDVLPVGFKVKADEVLYHPRCAHAPAAEVADNPVQTVVYLAADDHGLAVGSGEVLAGKRCGTLPADSLRCLLLIRLCGNAAFPGMSLADSSSTSFAASSAVSSGMAVSVSEVLGTSVCSGSFGSKPIRL